MKKLKITLVSFLVLSGFVTFVQADIISVPGDYPTIQEGINAAVNGDTVLVASGTYTGNNNKNLDFQGKNIIVESEDGPTSTIIDCQGTGRGVYFHSGETKESVLSGFTIKNGSIKIFNALGGSGICCENSSPTIEFNIIESNSSGWAGGGIFCNNASPIIRHNIITNNSAKWGAGIACVNSSSPTIADNDITNNEASPFDGGGIYFRDSSPTIASNIIDGNLVQSILPGGWGGGGIFCINSSGTIENNIITNNSVDDSITGQGGALRCLSSSLTIINNTISGNSARRAGDGITCRSGSSVAVLNTILWENGTEEVDVDGSSNINITYSDIQGGWTGMGNIDANPAFTGDYHLSDSSPCIGAGTITPDVPTKDFEGEPRPNPAGSNPDMGADENPLATPSTPAAPSIAIANSQPLTKNIKPTIINSALGNAFPSPANPEVWIPYRLNAAANVTITIYNAAGQVVRMLDIGHRPGGIYENKQLAAHWDGRNARGEKVSSGLYFYMLKAGDFTATRKLFIIR